MRAHTKGISAVFLAVVAVVAFSSPATAVTYTQTITDIYNNDSITDGQKITSASFGQDAGMYYFKMELADTPSLTVSDTDSTKNYASHYGIFIDASGNDDPIIDPTGYDDTTSLGAFAYKKRTGGLYALGFTPQGGQWESGELTVFGDMTFLRTDGVLEWSIPKGDIDSNFAWLAATTYINPSDSTLEVLSQTDSVIATPIPSAAWLLGSGLLGLIGLQRRRDRKA